jgi:probable F420-dependent oxidoreductase
MKLGISLPGTDLGPDPLALRDFTQLSEELGYDHLAAYENALNINPASLPGWDGVEAPGSSYHDPFVLLGYLAGQTTSIELSVQVLVLAQRQTALVAKQAASLDFLSGGRLRLGVGIGWDEKQFIALDEDFSSRGARSAEQVDVMKALWRDQYVDFDGKWHRIPDAGINPRPAGNSLEVWFGGKHDNVLQRIARIGDGWMPLHLAAADEAPREIARAEIETLMGYAEANGRRRDEIGIDGWVSMGAGTADDWRREILGWRELGASHITLNTAFDVGHHSRIAGRNFDDHAAAIREYMAVVKDLFETSS